MGAAGQSRSESSTLGDLDSTSNEQEKLANPCTISSCQTGLLNPILSPLVKPTEEPRKELDRQLEVKRKELDEVKRADSSDSAQLQGLSEASSDVCHHNRSSDQEQVQSGGLVNSYRELPIHPSPRSQDFLFFKAVEEAYEEADWKTDEEDELTPPSFLNSPSTSELHRMEGCGNSPSSRESSSREYRQQCSASG